MLGQIGYRTYCPNTESGGVGHAGCIEFKACNVGPRHAADGLHFELVPETRTVAAADMCLERCVRSCLDMHGASLLLLVLPPVPVEGGMHGRHTYSAPKAFHSDYILLMPAVIRCASSQT